MTHGSSRSGCRGGRRRACPGGRWHRVQRERRGSVATAGLEGFELVAQGEVWVERRRRSAAYDRLADDREGEWGVGVKVRKAWSMPARQVAAPWGGWVGLRDRRTPTTWSLRASRSGCHPRPTRRCDRVIRCSPRSSWPPRRPSTARRRCRVPECRVAGRATTRATGRDRFPDPTAARRAVTPDRRRSSPSRSEHRRAAARRCAPSRR